MAIVEIFVTNSRFVLIPIFLGCAYWLYNLAFNADFPKFAGIPELPDSIPFWGHLKYLGLDHATVFQKYGRDNDAEIVQAKLGNRRIVVVNSFKIAEEIFSKNASATIDRPLFWTFHGIVSSSQGGTIGSSPWDDSCKRRRTAVGAIMTRPAIQTSAPLLDLETSSLVKDMFLASQSYDEKTVAEVDPRIFFQRQSLNLTLMMCFAYRIKEINDPLFHEILHVSHSVSSFRSTNNNAQDYVPFLRYLPSNERSKLAKQNRDRRDIWLDDLLNKVQTAMEAGKPIQCVSEGLLRDKTSSKLTREEIKSINVSLVSGGFETLSTTSSAGLAFLSSPEGQATQQKAFDAIMQVYSTPEEAWEKCVLEEKVPYVVALVREVLRFYAPIQLGLPRSVYKPFNWRGTIIPKGVSIYPNTQAINHDPAAYGPDAETFRAERWLEPSNSYTPPLPHHYSYGAGSRMCTAVALSNRVLFATFVRLIVSCKLTASATAPPNIDYVDYNENRSDATVMVKRYKLLLEPRWPRERLVANWQTSSERTAGLGEF